MAITVGLVDTTVGYFADLILDVPLDASKGIVNSGSLDGLDCRGIIDNGLAKGILTVKTGYLGIYTYNGELTAGSPSLELNNLILTANRKIKWLYLLNCGSGTIVGHLSTTDTGFMLKSGQFIEMTFDFPHNYLKIELDGATSTDFSIAMK